MNRVTGFEIVSGHPHGIGEPTLWVDEDTAPPEFCEGLRSEVPGNIQFNDDTGVCSVGTAKFVVAAEDVDEIVCVDEHLTESEYLCINWFGTKYCVAAWKSGDGAEYTGAAIRACWNCELRPAEDECSLCKRAMIECPECLCPEDGMETSEEGIANNYTGTVICAECVSRLNEEAEQRAREAGLPELVYNPNGYGRLTILYAAVIREEMLADGTGTPITSRLVGGLIDIRGTGVIGLHFFRDRSDAA